MKKKHTNTCTSTNRAGHTWQHPLSQLADLRRLHIPCLFPVRELNPKVDMTATLLLVLSAPRLDAELLRQENAKSLTRENSSLF